MSHSKGEKTALRSGNSSLCQPLYDSAPDSPSEDEIKCVAPTLFVILNPPKGPATSLRHVGLWYNHPDVPSQGKSVDDAVVHHDERLSAFTIYSMPATCTKPRMNLLDVLAMTIARPR